MNLEVVATPEMMSDFADKAVIQARTAFSAKLDFTPRSIKTLEGCLGLIHTFLESSENTWTEIQMISFTRIYGGFFGEVVKRLCGGEWKDSPIDRPIFEVAGVECAPCDKVMKQIRDGADDNLYSYFEMLTQAIIPAAKGEPTPTPFEPQKDPSELKGDATRVFHSSGRFSVLVPKNWTHAEKENTLSCSFRPNVSVMTLVGMPGWIPFDDFARTGLAFYSEHTPVGEPQVLDGKNSVGRRYEFTKTSGSKTTGALVYCLQCPTYGVIVNVLSVIPFTDLARRLFDSLAASVDLLE